ncbi:MAG: 5-formyltetrahydrofolate cyclo-ligase [Candidatus Omnitrophica bacterium]|nr:5-formyltetrahydrofolate cyclo-ligase [Candidatus Omnitrophota bacterium]
MLTHSTSLSVNSEFIEGLTKKQIRSKILLRLKTQKEADRGRKSKIIKDKLFRTLVFKKAKIVMFYLSFDGEVNTQEMIKEAKKIGKTVTVPVCKSDRIIRPCILQHMAKLKKGLYGIREPAIKRFVNLEDVDLVIAPGVAFDKKGNRLGRGKGCYDNLLKKLSQKAVSIGLAFDFQILPFVPATITDAAVDRVIFA